jgi:hypothetical protein
VSDDAPEEQAPPPAEPDEQAPPAAKARRKRRRRPEPDAESAPERAPAAAAKSRGSDRWLILFTGILPWFLWKKVAEGAPPPEEEDDGLPAFARAFPREPALDALVLAFEAGDYARVRREAPALARSTDDDAVRAAARELRRRLDPDPLAVYLLAAAALLLTFLAGWYWAHPHTP